MYHKYQLVVVDTYSSNSTNNVNLFFVCKILLFSSFVYFICSQRGGGEASLHKSLFMHLLVHAIRFFISPHTAQAKSYLILIIFIESEKIVHKHVECFAHISE